MILVNYNDEVFGSNIIYTVGDCYNLIVYGTSNPSFNGIRRHYSHEDAGDDNILIGIFSL